MYSLNFGVTDPDALQGSKRRMMHLTAVNTTAIAPRWGSAKPLATDRRRRPRDPLGGHRCPVPRARNEPLPGAAVFRSGMRNSLETRPSVLHYSVIGRCATVSLASGYVGCRPLKDEVPASTSPCWKLRGSRFTVLSGRCEPVLLVGGSPWGSFYPVPMHREVPNDAYNPIGPVALRTGGRKSNAD